MPQLFRATRTTMFIISAIVLIAAAASTVNAAEVKRSDEFLAGYVTSVLERELGWDADGYCLSVEGGVVNITLAGDKGDREAAAKRRLAGIDGIADINFPEETVCAEPGWFGTLIGMDGGSEGLPKGDVFRPLLADPKQPRFFVSYNSYDSSVRRSNIAAVGFGESFGFYRWTDPEDDEALQIGMTGALFAQFDLDASSFDLINGDYVIGIPVFTYRNGKNSVRLRPYHQSSHLGDEYLLRVRPQRVNLSFESIELIYARDIWDIRLYGGGECIVHREPADLAPWVAHAGAEYIAGESFYGDLRLVCGVDLKSFEEHDWHVDISAKAGVQVGKTEPGERRVRVLGQLYRGYNPHGQFYTNKIEFYGLEVSFGF